MTSIAIQRVSKSYGRTPVLKGLDLDIRDGEFISFLGPSGCGKSTLLFCIAGLEEITEGNILFDGRDVSELSPRDRNVALVFQDYALYPHMLVRDNLAFPLRQQKVAEELVRKQVAWAAGLLGLEPLLDRSPAELSGGQRQRVAVGRRAADGRALVQSRRESQGQDAHRDQAPAARVEDHGRLRHA